MEIKRDMYLNKLILRMHNKMIKVVTGIRRCGKSYLLFNLFYDYLISLGIDNSHIIKIALDDIANKKYRNPEKLYNYIKKQITDSNMYYVLLDEVQLVSEFEDVLNGLLHINNVDTYVTGSNAKFLSKDIITEFRGRGDQIHVLPLSFSEYLSVYNGDKYSAFNDYLTYGGLPFVTSLSTHEQKTNYCVLKIEKKVFSMYNVISQNVANLFCHYKKVCKRRQVLWKNHIQLLMLQPA